MLPAKPTKPRQIVGAHEQRLAGHAVGAVARLLDIAAEAQGPSEIERALVREVCAVLAFDEVLLLGADDRSGAAEVTARWPEDEQSNGGRRRLSLGGLPAIADVRGGRDPLVLQGPDAAALASLLALTVRSPATLLLLPMCARQTTDDVLVSISREPRALDAAELELVSALGGAGAASLAQLRLAAAQEAQLAVQSALTRAAKALNESLDLGLVLTRICDEAARLVDAPYAVIMRGNAEEGLVVEAAYGLAPEVLGFHISSDASPLSMRVAQRDRGMFTNDPRVTASATTGGPFPRMGSAAGVPLRWDGQVRGVLAVGYPDPGYANAERLAHLEALADLAAAATRNASLHAGVAQAARTDGLTGCLNHAAMHESLRREIKRAERTDGELSLVLIDLDDFKQINEQHGHLFGDEVLRRVGLALRQSVRPYDVVARYGGDEFMIVAAETGEAGAAEVARRALERVEAGIGELELKAGASAGVAAWAAASTPTELIAQADRALLYGKQKAGRGGVILASGLPADFQPATADRQAGEPFHPPPGWAA
jgi:diguanylate cyclase (GGDEF)-like protein